MENRSGSGHIDLTKDEARVQFVAGEPAPKADANPPRNKPYSGLIDYPIGSMYGIYTDMYHKNQPNVGKYTSPMDPMGIGFPQ